MGRPWDVVILRTRLANLWNIHGKFDLVDVGHNLFIIRNLDPTIRESILTKGPWKLAGQFLAIQKWFPEFDPTTFKMTKAITWVRIFNIPPQFYRESILLQIARCLGEPIKADASTFWRERGRYARLCVQVDVSKPVEKGIMINDRRYAVVYENLPSLCYSCGRAEHSTTVCPNTRKEESNVNTERSETDSPTPQEPRDSNSTPTDSNSQAQREDEYGPWLLMKRKGKKKQNASQRNSQSAKEDNSIKGHTLILKRNDSRIPLSDISKQTPRRATSSKNKQQVYQNRFASLGDSNKENLQAPNMDNINDVCDKHGAPMSARYTVQGHLRDVPIDGVGNSHPANGSGGGLSIRHTNDIMLEDISEMPVDPGDTLVQ